VTEFWFFQNNQAVYHQRNESYELVGKSELFPNLYLSIFAEYVIAEDALDAAIAFR